MSALARTTEINCDTRAANEDCINGGSRTRTKFVYVANQGSNNISAFSLASPTGALTPVAGSPFAAGNQPSSLAIDPTGAFAYVVNTGSDTVSVYAIDAAGGALSPISGSPFVTGTQPAAIAISD
jgi:6-phosphogluconolactonase